MNKTRYLVGVALCLTGAAHASSDDGYTPPLYTTEHEVIGKCIDQMASREGISRDLAWSTYRDECKENAPKLLERATQIDKEVEQASIEWRIQTKYMRAHCPFDIATWGNKAVCADKGQLAYPEPLAINRTIINRDMELTKFLTRCAEEANEGGKEYNELSGIGANCVNAIKEADIINIKMGYNTPKDCMYSTIESRNNEICAAKEDFEKYKARNDR